VKLSGGAIGQRYEAIARKHLEHAGLRIIETGYRCRLGELDLICQQRSQLVVVEVRARRSASRVSAAESVDRFKQRRIVAATRHFLMTHPFWAERPLRFDVVAISNIDTNPHIDWICDAFQAT
jgi:putative endonuclease